MQYKNELVLQFKIVSKLYNKRFFMGVFKKAERKKVHFKLAISGPSGSGKTFSSLMILKGLIPNGKIAVIDTEAGSSQLYAGRPGVPEFDVIELGPPYTTERYLELMQAAVREKYDGLIIDSTSHQWNSEGGILDRKEKEQLAKPGLNGFTLFAKYTPEHERFKMAILHADIHIIATMRSKVEYAMEQNDRGKTVPRRVGLAPIQREGFDYEFTTMLDLSVDHYATTSKDRTGLFDGKHFMPNEETGTQIHEWLMTGKEVWKFTEQMKSDLRTLMTSFATGKQVFKTWESLHGAISGIDEPYYLGLTQKLVEERQAVKENPESFDNFNGGVETNGTTDPA